MPQTEPDTHKYKIDLKRAAVDVKRLADDVLILRTPYALPALPSHTGMWLRKWAAETPERVFLVESSGAEITYGAALEQVLALAAGLAAQDLSPDRPLLILSENSIQQALLQLAALEISVPVIPIDPTLAIEDAKFSGFKHILEQVTPGLIFADDGRPVQTVLHYVAAKGFAILLGEDPGDTWGPEVTLIEDLISADLEDLNDATAPATTTAKTISHIQFSGTTPSEMTGIVTRQETLCADQEALSAVIPALQARPPLIIDNTPWHLAQNGNLIFNVVLRNGGTLYIEGYGEAIQEGEAESTNPALPTLHFSDPAALEELVIKLEENSELCRSFFGDLDLIWIIGGTITPSLYLNLQKLAMAQTGYPLPLLTSFSGIASPALCTILYFDTETFGNIGLPLPGTLLKLTRSNEPTDTTSGIEVKRSTAPPAIWRDGELIEVETDSDGYYPLYETVRLIDDAHPTKGLQRVSKA